MYSRINDKDFSGFKIYDPKKIISLEDKFWGFVDKKGPDDCWEWNGNILSQGYGRMYHHSTNEPKAHRLSYMINVGEIPKGALIRHSCNNPKCVNPNHLSIGTNQDNSDDMKNTNRSLTGEKHPQSKLTNKDIIEIRNMFFKSKCKITTLAYKYGVSDAAIHSIVTGNSWKHIGGPISKLSRSKKLNQHHVVEIRKLFITGKYTLKKLGDKFGVSYATIRGIVYGSLWKTAGGPISLFKKGKQ